MSTEQVDANTGMVPRSELHALLRRSFAMRAHAYAHLFDVLRERLGETEALSVCMEATERMGRDMGTNFAKHGPSDIDGLKTAFLGGIIEGEGLFGPEVTKCAADGLEIRFHRCPLKEAWQAQGRSDADLEALCRMAGAIDRGMFERAGFTFAGTTWSKGESGCCTLRVLPGPRAR